MGASDQIGVESSPEATIARRLHLQAEACERLGSPLYAGLLERAAADVASHGPTWGVLRGHERDSATSAMALRLMGAVNRLVLRGDEPMLADAYRSGDGSAAWPEFKAVLERNTHTLRQLIELPVQTNEVARCAALLPGFLKIASETDMPLRLLEVGASAGLNLRWDRYRYSANGFTWGPVDSPVTIEFKLEGRDGLVNHPTVDIAERLGCDPAAIDPATEAGRLSLLAYVWPDQRDRVKRLHAALDVAARLPVAIARETAASWVKRQLAARSRGQATVLYHSIVTQYMSDNELTEFLGSLQEAGSHADNRAPLAWLRMEPAGEWANVRLTTWPSGEDRHLARAGYHGNPVGLLVESQ